MEEKMTKCSRSFIFSDRLCRFQPPTALGCTALSIQHSASCIMTYDIIRTAGAS